MNFAQPLPTRPAFTAGNGTNEIFLRIGKKAMYISWDTTYHRYWYVDSTITSEKDTIYWGDKDNKTFLNHFAKLWSDTTDLDTNRANPMPKLKMIRFWNGYRDTVGIYPLDSLAYADSLLIKNNTWLGTNRYKKNVYLDSLLIVRDTVGITTNAIDVMVTKSLAGADSYIKAGSFKTVVTNNDNTEAYGLFASARGGTTNYAIYADSGKVFIKDSLRVGTDNMFYVNGTGAYIKDSLKVGLGKFRISSLGKITRMNDKVFDWTTINHNNTIVWDSVNNKFKWSAISGTIDTTRISYLAKTETFTGPKTFNADLIFGASARFYLPAYDASIAGTMFYNGTVIKYYDSGVNLRTLPYGTGTTDEIAYFSGSTTLASLTTGTYPSKIELSYVKGVTSAIQTQLNGKQATLVSGTNIKTINSTSLLGSGDLIVQAQLNGTGFVKASGTSISYDNSTYLTGNQTITLGGILSGSGTTSITVSAASGYYMPTTTDQTNWNNKAIAPATNFDNYIPLWNGANSKTLSNGLSYTSLATASTIVSRDGSGNSYFNQIFAESSNGITLGTTSTASRIALYGYASCLASIFANYLTSNYSYYLPDGGGTFAMTSRTLTINGSTQDLSANRTWTITDISGNAGTVTNGVYTNTTQTISGQKTFSQQYTYFGSSGSVPGEVVLYNDVFNPTSTRLKTSGSVGSNITLTVPSTTGNIALTSDIMTPKYANVYADSSETINCLSGFSYYKWNKFAIGDTSGITASIITDKITINSTGKYKISYSFTYQNDSGADVYFTIYKNGVDIGKPATTIYTADPAVYRVSSNEFIASLSATDYLEVYVKASGGATTTTIYRASITVTKISN